MGNVPAGMHQCPTRVDGGEALFAHTVTKSMCQDRQRGSYHKCFTCAHNNRYVGETSAKPVAELPPAGRRVEAKAG